MEVIVKIIDMGRIIVITGPMYSGKTTRLIQEIEKFEIANKAYVVFKPSIDIRYGLTNISNHKGLKVEAIPIKKSDEIFEHLEEKRYNLIAIDEAQFFDEKLPEIVQNLADEGYTVILSCLDMDFKRQPFKVSSELLSIADSVIKNRAVCERCGSFDAAYSFKLKGDENQIDVGGKDKYIAVCRKCYRELSREYYPSGGIFKKDQ
jgi:thymidine kinase